MYAIGIVAHTARLAQAETLAEQVHADYMSVDDGTLGAEANHRKVWSKLAGTGEPWVCVLEDDAVPVDNFRDQLTQALTAVRTPIVGLYLGHPQHWTNHTTLKRRLTQAGQRADKQDANFITTNELIHGVGICIRTNLVPSMLAYQSNRPIDYHIRNWARSNGHTISLCWPSILDHADGDTLINHPDGYQRGQRKAWRTGTREHWTPKAAML